MVERPPPPLVGMHPTTGRKAVGCARAETAWKTTLRYVEIPGLIGLPSSPSQRTSSVGSPRIASSPPAMLRFGHVTW